MEHRTFFQILFDTSNVSYDRKITTVLLIMMQSADVFMHGLGYPFFRDLWINVILLLIAQSDQKNRKIPNVLNMGLIAVIPFEVLRGAVPVRERLAAMIICALMLLILAKAGSRITGTGRCGIGGGDMKLLLVSCFLLGKYAVPYIYIVSAVVLPCLLYRMYRKERGVVAMGPYFAIGLWVTYLLWF